MSGGPNFIDREVFRELIVDVPRADGTPYQDIETIYGDMSRLVVALLARSTAEELRALYNELGWLGNGNGRAMHEAAVLWMSRYRSEGLSITQIGPDVE